MARFPIQSTERTLPGQSSSVYVNTGGEAIGQAIQGLGAAGERLGQILYRKQGETELAEALSQDRADIDQMLLDFQKNPDETTYGEKFDKVWGGIENRELKNGWARRQRALRLPQLREANSAVVAAAVWKRADDKAKMAVANTAAEAEKTGNTRLLEIQLDNMVRNGGMYQEERDEILRETRHKAAVNQALVEAWDDPEAFISRYSTAEEFLAKDSNLRPEDVSHVIGAAQHAKSAQQARRNEIQIESEQRLWEISLDPNTTTQDFVAAIDNLPPELYSPADKDSMLKNGISRMRLIAAGNPDPLQTRQDYNAFKELLFGVVDGTTKEADIRGAVNAGQITIGDYTMLTNVLAGKTDVSAQAYNLSNVLRQMDRLIDDSDAFYLRGNLGETAKIKGHRMIEDSMRAAEEKGKPLQGWNLMEEMLRVERELEGEAYGAADAASLLPIGGAVVQQSTAPGSEVRTATGQLLGTYNAQGKIVLSREHIQRMVTWAKGEGITKEQLEEILKNQGYIIP